MIELLKVIPAITGTIDRILDRLPEEEMRARYHTPEGLRIKIEVEGAEIYAMIRQKPEAEP